MVYGDKFLVDAISPSVSLGVRVAASLIFQTTFSELLLKITSEDMLCLFTFEAGMTETCFVLFYSKI